MIFWSKILVTIETVLRHTPLDILPEGLLITDNEHSLVSPSGERILQALEL
jgi:hypothetical protein